MSFGQAAPTSPLNYNVHLFYYPWYGAVNGPTKQWNHWNGGGRKPPEDITSNYYPVLGAYDSCDAHVLAEHMQWISQSGAGVIITSWWGKGGFEDKCIKQIMDQANKHHIKVGFHIEPYGGRSGQSVANDVNYINQNYGSHPAYFRDPDHNGNKPAFYVFADSTDVKDWSPIDHLRDHNIILSQTTDQSRFNHFNGFYNYAIGNHLKIVGIWKGMNDFCKVPNSKAAVLDRQNGTMYDNNWNWVSIQESLIGFQSLHSMNGMKDQCLNQQSLIHLQAMDTSLIKVLIIRLVKHLKWLTLKELNIGSMNILNDHIIRFKSD